GVGHPRGEAGGDQAVEEYDSWQPSGRPQYPRGCRRDRRPRYRTRPASGRRLTHQSLSALAAGGRSPQRTRTSFLSHRFVKSTLAEKPRERKEEGARDLARDLAETDAYIA